MCPVALTEQLLAFVSELCADLPTVLVVDDLQWADHASVTLWERLSRSARHLPLLLVGMMRPVPQREDLLALRHSADLAARLQLDGLPEESVTELVETLAGGKPDAELLRLADGAAGNPLYLTELVDALARSSSLTVFEWVRGGHQRPRAADPCQRPSPTASASFPRGCGRSCGPPHCWAWTFPCPTWPPCFGRGVADLVPAVNEAHAAGVLAESGSGLGFRHPADPCGAVRGASGPGAGRLAP